MASTQRVRLLELHKSITESVLLAKLQAHLESSNVAGVTLERAHALFHNELPPAYSHLIDKKINECFNNLIRYGYFENLGEVYVLTFKGVSSERFVEADPLLETEDSVSRNALPASDRFVSLSDNQSAAEEMTAAVTGLEAAIEATQTNALSSDEKDALRREASAYRTALSAGRVRESLLLAFKRVVERLQRYAQTIEALAIATAAGVLADAITKFLLGI